MFAAGFRKLISSKAVSDALVPRLAVILHLDLQEHAFSYRAMPHGGCRLAGVCRVKFRRFVVCKMGNPLKPPGAEASPGGHYPRCLGADPARCSVAGSAGAKCRAAGRDSPSFTYPPV